MVHQSFLRAARKRKCTQAHGNLEEEEEVLKSSGDRGTLVEWTDEICS